MQNIGCFNQKAIATLTDDWKVIFKRLKVSINQSMKIDWSALSEKTFKALRGNN